MSSKFVCTYCNIRSFSTRSALTQHVKRCIETCESSIGEFNIEISDTNKMLLDSDDFSQSIQKENESSFNTSNIQESDQEKYTNDASFSNTSQFSNLREYPENFEIDQEYTSQLSNLPEYSENFEEILPESLQNFEKEPEIKDFPNEAYADLMKLVIKHDLNNKAGNAIIKFFNKHSNLAQSPLPKNIETGRKFMDKMNISHLAHYKYNILSYDNEEYFIHYRPILECIENLLSNSEITQHFVYEYKNMKVDGEKSYSEQFTGNWWKDAENSIPRLANILSIILYSDATTTDTLGKNSLHPIYISLGNIPTWRRNKEDAKQLLGYLPIVFAKNESEKKSPHFKKLVCETFHNSIKFLLDPLFKKDGIDLNINNEKIWFYPRISTIICN